MKAVVVLLAAVASACVAAMGQGQFLFNSHHPSAGNDVRLFFPDCQPATGPDINLQVFAGADAAHLTPLTPLLPLNATGDAAGYPNPFAQIFTVPGMFAGTEATVGYIYFQGASLETATATTGVLLALAPVALTDAPSSANEVSLGIQTIGCPEPSTWFMLLLGLGGIVFASLRARSSRPQSSPGPVRSTPV